MFENWENRPYITAALIRSVDTAYRALRDGADGIIIFWSVFQDMMVSSLTDEWNSLFLENWDQMYDAGLLEGIPYKRN